MYCNNCHTIIPNKEIKCPKCGHINENEELEETKEIDLNEVFYKQKKRKKKIIQYLGMIILISIVIIISIYIFHDSNILNNNAKQNHQLKDEKLKLNEIFTFNNIEIKFNKEEYGTSKNTIFNKKDNNYNIELNLIKQNDYNKYLNEFMTSNTNLGKLKTKSFELNSSTAYIFISKGDYYLLKINYDTSSSTLEHLKYSNDLSRISNTIQEK